MQINMTAKEFHACLSRSSGPFEIIAEKRENYAVLLCFCGTNAVLTADVGGKWTVVADFKHRSKAFILKYYENEEDLAKIEADFEWFSASLKAFLKKKPKKKA